MTNPPPSTTALLDCIQTQDFSRQEGKKALWRALRPFGPKTQDEFSRIRDEYLAQGFKAAEANHNAAADVAADIEAMRSRNVAAIGPDGEGLLVQMEVSPPFPDPAPKRSHQTQFDRLMAKVRESSRGAHCGIGPSVTWVSANLRTRMEDIEPEGVPGCEALSMWLWASQNETEYRRLYDSKRIPSRGIAEDDRTGFVDDGSAILDVMDRIRDGVAATLSTGDSNVPMRDLQAEKPNGNDHQPEGGLHDLPGRTSEGGAGDGSGRPTGHGGGPEPGEGSDHRGPVAAHPTGAGGGAEAYGVGKPATSPSG